MIWKTWLANFLQDLNKYKFDKGILVSDLHCFQFLVPVPDVTLTPEDTKL